MTRYKSEGNIETALCRTAQVLPAVTSLDPFRRGRSSLQDGAFPGRSLGKSVYAGGIAIGASRIKSALVAERKVELKGLFEFALADEP